LRQFLGRSYFAKKLPVAIVNRVPAGWLTVSALFATFDVIIKNYIEGKEATRYRPAQNIHMNLRERIRALILTIDINKTLKALSF